jgi:Nucleotide-sugar transporter
MQCVRNCDSPDPKQWKHFEQPVIQTAQMFIGEMGCWIVVGIYSVYKRMKARRAQDTSGEPTESDPLLADDDTLAEEDPLASSLVLPHDGRIHLQGWRVVYLALPACCDIAGTTLMNVGLLFVAASIYQMTRGALVLFVGLFSVLFLKRYLAFYKWFSLFIVVSGVAIVGLAGALAKDHKAVPSVLSGFHDEIKQHMDTVAAIVSKSDGESDLALRTIVGVLLIAAAQIFTATQFVLEESIMEKYSLEPLKAVGWEGVWGFLVTVIGMIVLHLAYGRTDAGRYGYFDAREGLREILHYRSIGVSSLLIMVSIG